MTLFRKPLHTPQVMRHRPCSLRRGGRREVRIPSLSIERAHGTPDARCVRSLVCENEKAHESSRHENTGHARRSVRGAFAGLLREQGPRRPTHVCWATDGGGLTSHRRARRAMVLPPGAEATAPGPRGLGRHRRGAVVSPRQHAGLPRRDRRTSNTAASPPHPASQTVTIASRPSH